MARISYYNRLEPRPRKNDFRSSLAAPIRDPLWFLTRQWQMGEFRATDNGSLAYVQYAGRTSTMPRWLRDGSEVAIDAGAPLEPQTLREPFTPDLSLQVELGHDFADYLREEVTPTEAEVLLAAFQQLPRFQVRPPDDELFRPLDAASRAFSLVCAGKTHNGYELYRLGQDIAVGGDVVPAEVTTVPEQRQAVERALSRLVERVTAVFGEIGGDDPTTWEPSRLEYGLRVIASEPSGAGNATLAAQPNTDGEFEWFSFDVASKDATAGEEPPVPIAFSMVPARVEFDGMPSTRFWTFEANSLALPDVPAGGADDLLKLLITDFMLVHGNDWFVLPLSQRVGTLAKTDHLVVADVFGKRTVVERADKDAGAPGTDRWTLFSITDASGASERLADYFIVPPSPGPALQVGTILEDVRFGRDETANLAFGIERVTESAIGEARSGRQRDAEIDARRNLAPPTPTPSGFPLRYGIQDELPANWSPLLPVKVEPGSPEIALEVGAALKETGEGAAQPVPALGKILNPTRGGDHYRIHEEELPRSGLRVERIVCRTRWLDGSTHLWVQRRRRVGAGESQSGLDFDQARPNEG